MKKFFKRLAILAVVLVVGLAAAAFVGRGMLKGTPTFYRTYSWDSTQRSIVSQRAADKLLQTRQLAQQAHFGEVRAQRSAAQQGGSTAKGATTGAKPATQPAKPNTLTVNFTEEELNAFLFHNSETFADWKQKYERYITDPGVFLDDGRLILAAKSKDVGAVVSLHFAPRLTPEGQLELKRAGAYGGNLPLPEALLTPYVDRLKGALTARMPGWLAAARLDRNGGFNSSAAAAGMSRLLLNALDNKPSEPVLFMPVDEGQTSAPLKIAKVGIEGRTLSLTLEPMARPEREALFERLTSAKPGSAAGAAK